MKNAWHSFRKMLSHYARPPASGGLSQERSDRRAKSRCHKSGARMAFVGQIHHLTIICLVNKSREIPSAKILRICLREEYNWNFSLWDDHIRWYVFLIWGALGIWMIAHWRDLFWEACKVGGKCFYSFCHKCLILLLACLISDIK